MSDPPNVDTGAANYVGSVYVFDGPSDEKSKPLKVIVVVAGASKVLTRRGVHSRSVVRFVPTQNSPGVVFEGGQPDRRECDALDRRTDGQPCVTLCTSRARRARRRKSQNHVLRSTRSVPRAPRLCICAESDDAMEGLAHSYSSFHKISADFFI